MMPLCDQTGVPIHFHSSTTSGSASLMSLRILLRVFPRQSPSSAIFFEMSSDADWPWLASDFFMFSSWKFQLQRRSPASCLAGLLFAGPSPPVGGEGRMAPRVGFEPTTLRLTAGCSAVELPRNDAVGPRAG